MTFFPRDKKRSSVGLCQKHLLCYNAVYYNDINNNYAFLWTIIKGTHEIIAINLLDAFNKRFTLTKWVWMVLEAYRRPASMWFALSLKCKQAYSYTITWNTSVISCVATYVLHREENKRIYIAVVRKIIPRQCKYFPITAF